MRNVDRKERKFLLDAASALQLESQLGAVLKHDEHNRPGGYMVRSLYFDTPHENDYVEKLFGLAVRRKVRLRTYSPDASFALLELKQKQGDVQRKRSLFVTRDEARSLINGSYDFLATRPEPFAAEMHALMSINGYRPKAIVEYDRTAFTAQENSTRITLDRNIRATETYFDIFDENLCLTSVFDPFNVVLEVKYNGFLLSYIRSIVNRADKSELSVSKYCLARSATMAYQF
jgi:hypothetical protein